MDDPRVLERFALFVDKAKETFPGRIDKIELIGEPGNFVVMPKWVTPPTVAETTAFNVLLAGWDWRARNKRAIANVVTQIEALAPAIRQSLLNRVLAEYLIDHPKVADTIGIVVDDAST